MNTCQLGFFCRILASRYEGHFWIFVRSSAPSKVRVIPGGPTVENDIAVDSQPSSQILNGHSKTTDVLQELVHLVNWLVM